MPQKKEQYATEEKMTAPAQIAAKTPPVAEPASLGLIGLAIAALVLSSSDLNMASGNARSLMIPWVLFFGATAQLIAGLMEFRRNNVFGATVFSVYAMTMYSIALTLIIIYFTNVQIDITHYAYGLTGILVFSLIATAASVMTNKTFFAILLMVDLAVASLIPHYLLEISSIPAGLFLLLTSVLSFYGAAAILLNTLAGKQLLPLGKALWTPVK